MGEGEKWEGQERGRGRSKRKESKGDSAYGKKKANHCVMFGNIVGDEISGVRLHCDTNICVCFNAQGEYF